MTSIARAVGWVLVFAVLGCEATPVPARVPTPLVQQVAGRPADNPDVCRGSGSVATGAVVTPSIVFPQPTTTAAHSPPPISGGTLLRTRDGKLLVAADPDRDQVYFVDAVGQRLLFVRQLQPGDEPGRMVEDQAGRIHVALRGAAAIASMTRTAADPIERRAVCDLPRGIAYDALHDELQVGCAEGKLVNVAAASGGTVSRRVELGADVRDVIVRGSELFVSRFRSAELLELDGAGAVVRHSRPPTLGQTEVVFDANDCDGRKEQVFSAPTVAWRQIPRPRHAASCCSSPRPWVAAVVIPVDC